MPRIVYATVTDPTGRPRPTLGRFLVAAVTGRKIRVHAVGISCGSTASTVQFSSGGSTAVSCVFQNSISLPYNPKGWFETDAGEALTVDTGSGSTTGILVLYSTAT